MERQQGREGSDGKGGTEKSGVEKGESVGAWGRFCFILAFVGMDAVPVRLYVCVSLLRLVFVRFLF